MLYDKDSRKYKLIFSGRKQIGGCLGEEVRREELKKDMEKLLRIMFIISIVVALGMYTYVKMHIVHFICILLYVS